MSEALELSLDTQCYLCDLFFTQSNEPFILYKCFCCMKFTPYCFSCELKIQRLFGRGNFFKCTYCNKLTNAIDKIEINPQNIKRNINLISNPLSTKNSSYFKTPIKSLIENNSLLRLNSHNSQNEEEKKDNNNSIISSDNNVISNFIKEFSLFDLASNSNNRNITKIRNPEINNNMINSSLTIIRDNNINNYTKNRRDISNYGNRNRALTNSNSVNDFRKINDYSLLKDRKRINRKYFANNNFLGKKRDESGKSDEFRGYNKSRDKIRSHNEGNFKPKQIITKNMSRLYNGNNNIDGSALTRGKLGLYSAVNNSRTQYFDFKNSIMNNNGNSGNPMGNNYNICTNLFSNQNGIVSIGLNNAISGTATPHKFNTKNDEQYF